MEIQERVRDTLIHELCHAACWLITGVKAGHGPQWKYWARRANSIYPNIPVIARCHSYDIKTKFLYSCLQCGHEYGRHSKSINTDTARCGYCKGTLRLKPRLKKDGTPMKQREPSKFALFVKTQYSSLKKTNEKKSHSEIMKLLSAQFKQSVSVE